jgi:hypothetical protein
MRQFSTWDTAAGKARVCSADDALTHLMWILSNDDKCALVGATPRRKAYRSGPRVTKAGCTHTYSSTVEQFVLLRLLPTLKVSYLSEALTPALERKLAALVPADRDDPAKRHYFQGEDFSLAQQLSHPLSKRRAALALWLGVVGDTC